MKFINRCVITLKPKAPLIDWVKNLEGAEVPEVWDFEGGAYLFDEHETEESLLADIEKKSTAMIENELATWTEDEQLWPAGRNYQALQQMFEIHIAVAAFDLGRETLLRADIADIL